MPGSGGLLIGPALAAVPIEGERRARQDRRGASMPGRRGSRISAGKRRLLTLGGDIAAIVVLVAGIVFAVSHERPILAGQPTVVQSLADRVPLTKPLLVPRAAPDTGRLAALLASPQFAADSANFAA